MDRATIPGQPTQQRQTRRRFLHRLALGAGAAALAPALAACGGAQAPPAARLPVPPLGGTLNVRIAADPVVFDYAYANDPISQFVIANCVEPLLTVDAQGQVAPLLAKRWESPDAQTYLLKLRQGVTFQDGASLTADAVVRSLNRVRGDKTTTGYKSLLPIERIGAPDPTTVRIVLSAPFAPFISTLAGPAASVISPALTAAAASNEERLRTDLTGQGTGPFRFAGWKRGVAVGLLRNMSYWGRGMGGRALPYVDGMALWVIGDEAAALAALHRGKVDAFRPGEPPPLMDIDSVLADASLCLLVIPNFAFGFLLFNELVPSLARRELRQAVAYAIDRDALVRQVFPENGYPLDTVFAPSSWVSDPAYRPYPGRDLARAKQLLAATGQASDSSFSLLFNSDVLPFQQLAELIKSQLGEAGINLTLRPEKTGAESKTLATGDYQLANAVQIANSDPDTWLAGLFNSPGAQDSASHYSNRELDELLAQGRATLDAAKRRSIYQRAQRLIMADAPIVVLYGGKSFSLTAASVRNYPFGQVAAVDLARVWKAG